MKKLLLILAVIGAFTLSSCSGGFNPEKATELVQKIKSNSFSESDVIALLGQYEASTKEFYTLKKKKDKGEISEEEYERLHNLSYATHIIETTLRDHDVEKMCPGTEKKVFEIYDKYGK